MEQISPLLDEALATLGEKDRQAVLLRFFENKSLAQVGNNLGSAEDTARKRVSRALEKLRRFFRKRGVVSTTAIIAGAISLHSVQAAPAVMAISVTGVAVAKGAAAGTSTLVLAKGAIKIMAWTKAKTAIVAGTIVILAAGTASLTLKEIEKSKTDDSWRIQQNFDSRVLDQASPQVRIVPSKFSQFGGWGESKGKIMGFGAPLNYVVQASWDFGYYRTIFRADLPQTRYDFIASLPSGNREAL